MPPDINGAVRKFIPNNPRLADAVAKSLRTTFSARVLPLDLVKLVVDRGFELSRQQDMNLESKIFEEKLNAYANQLKPRFMAKINAERRRGSKW